jgi:hypothetical protein
MGIYSKIIDVNTNKTKELGLKMGYWLSSNPIVIQSNIKRKNKLFPHTLSYMVKIQDLELHLQNRPSDKEILLKMGYSTLKTINKLKISINSKPIKSVDYSIEEIKKFDERIDRFWDKIKGSFGFIIDKNLKYLNWRYDEHSSGNYVIRQVVQGDEILSYIVLGIKDYNDYKEGYVMDLLASPKRADIVEPLLREGCSILNGMGINVIYYLVNHNSPYQDISSKIGFLNSYKHPNIGCHFNDLALYNKIRRSSSEKVYFGYAETL